MLNLRRSRSPVWVNEAGAGKVTQLVACYIDLSASQLSYTKPSRLFPPGVSTISGIVWGNHRQHEYCLPLRCWSIAFCFDISCPCVPRRRWNNRWNNRWRHAIHAIRETVGTGTGDGPYDRWSCGIDGPKPWRVLALKRRRGCWLNFCTLSLYVWLLCLLP